MRSIKDYKPTLECDECDKYFLIEQKD